jgi:B9 domain-containing protein 1
MSSADTVCPVEVHDYENVVKQIVTITRNPSSVGSALVPLSAGQHIIEMDTYVPLANSLFNQGMGWLMGNVPEFYDSKFVCQGEGREVTRVRGTGAVIIKLNVVTKGASRL